MRFPLIGCATAVIALSACQDVPSAATEADALQMRASSQSSNTTPATAEVSTVRWNREALRLFRARGGDAGRMLAYVSLAQYRAVLAVDDARHGKSRPSPGGAVASASATVLKQFFPLDVAAIDALLAAQQSEPALADEHNKSFSDGVSIGNGVGSAVLALAATDNFGQTSPGVPPVGTGYWTSSGAPIVRGGLGARPFFLTSAAEVRAAPPPAFGSTAFLAGLAEVRALSDARTADQVAIVRKWVPFSAPPLNDLADELITKYHRSEREAARILAYANAASFDAIIGCFDSKFIYWFIRPTQADPLITLAVGLPNHPSYPSAHSCQTGAIQGVLDDAFPSEKAYISSVAEEASLSRVIGGLHYRFDGEAGLELGRTTARIALTRRGLE